MQSMSMCPGLRKQMCPRAATAAKAAINAPADPALPEPARGSGALIYLELS
jgi:hypothetical protein